MIRRMRCRCCSIRMRKLRRRSRKGIVWSRGLGLDVFEGLMSFWLGLGYVKRFACDGADAGELSTSTQLRWWGLKLVFFLGHPARGRFDTVISSLSTSSLSGSLRPQATARRSRSTSVDTRVAPKTHPHVPLNFGRSLKYYLLLMFCTLSASCKSRALLLPPPMTRVPFGLSGDQ